MSIENVVVKLMAYRNGDGGGVCGYLVKSLWCVHCSPVRLEGTNNMERVLNSDCRYLGGNTLRENSH